jgi:hypothetical protein
VPLSIVNDRDAILVDDHVSPAAVLIAEAAVPELLHLQDAGR